MHKKWSDYEIELLRDNYKDFGYRINELSYRSKLSITRMANRLKLYVNKDKIKRKPCCKPMLCSVNSDSFITNLTPESAYLLGFIWADGYLNNKSQSWKISMEIVSEDANDIIDIFNYTGKWTINTRVRNSTDNCIRKPTTIITTTNMTLYQYLACNNYEEKSSLNAKIINNIPENLQNYWWRGYFDGDGCIYITKSKQIQLCICSSYNQDWLFFEELSNSINCNFNMKRRIQYNKNSGVNNTFSCIRLTGKQNCKKFLDYIYSGKQFGLKRKFNKYKSYYYSEISDDSL